jgi:hypothetical protein
MRRGWPLLLFLCACVASLLRSTEVLPARVQQVEIAPTWTSIYIGTVSLKMPAFTRTPAGDYQSTYAARVLPLFFYNESGRLSIQVSNDALAKLQRGEPIDFSGRAVNQDGEDRPITGKATPADAAGGKIKVRVRVSAKIELIFNTTYRFTGK